MQPTTSEALNLKSKIPPPTHHLHSLHERTFDDYRYVYPVLSRRSGGMSIGVNLNPDKVCNFDCIYCQVDRSVQGETKFVGMSQLLEELREVLALVASGQIYQTQKFSSTPAALRRLNDIAFSGDGEPTTFKNFDEILAASAEIKRAADQDAVKMVLISNASMFHRPHVMRGLEILDKNQGEIWAKLDAGTSDYYQVVDRTPISFERILENITQAAQVRPIVIQSLFMRVKGQPPSQAELEAYADRLAEILTAGGQLSLIQIYTIARQPTESFVTPLADAEVDAIVQLVRSRIMTPVTAFYGAAY